MVDSQARAFIEKMIGATQQSQNDATRKLPSPKRGRYTTLSGIANELLLCRLDAPKAVDPKTELQRARYAIYKKALAAGLLKPGMIVKLHAPDEGMRLITRLDEHRVIGTRLRLVVGDAALDKMTNREVMARLNEPDLERNVMVINGQFFVDTGKLVPTMARTIQRVGIPDAPYRGFVPHPSYKLVDIRAHFGS